MTACSPGHAVFAVCSVAQLVMDHGGHGQRPGVATQEGHFTTVQDPHGPLHVVQRPLQVGGLIGHTVQLEVQQRDAWCRESRLVTGGALIQASTAAQLLTCPAGVGGEVMGVCRLQALLHLLEQVFDFVLDFLLESCTHLEMEHERNTVINQSKKTLK